MEDRTSISETEVLNLNPKQELFCTLYATDRYFFGNGTQAYIEAYDIDTTQKNYYKVAMAAASRLLSNVKILKRIRQLLELGGLNDERVDKELLFLIEQSADMSAKLGAIKEYNSLKSRIQSKLDLTSKGDKITGITVEFIDNATKPKGN